MRKTYIFIVFISFMLAICAAVPAPLAIESVNPTDYAQEIAPLKEHQRVTMEIVRNLKKNHYRKFPMDDSLSNKVFDRYLSMIDPMRLYFLTTDLKEFEPYRYHLIDSVVVGDVTPAFKVYNRYQTRFAQRLIFLINHIDSGLNNLNLEQDEYFEIEREKAPWPSSRADIENLWLKGLKNEVINLKLDGKTMEEISTTLSKRYHNQLNRIRQTTSEDIFQLFMEALCSSYDPHTSYFSPRSSENFNINMSLSLEGIGAMLGVDNEYTKVVDLVPAGPADKSGQIKPGDRIIGVGQGPDGEIVDVVGWRLDDVVDLIRGPKNTDVRLKTIPSNGGETQSKIVRLTRKTVQLEEQAASKQVIEITRGTRQYKIGVIDIPTFYLDIRALQAGAEDYKSTTTDVRRIINELTAQKVDGIVIDLRDNGGGSLQEANSLVGLFIKRGPTVQIKNNDGSTDVLYDRDPRIFYSGPLAVIINRMSASASEIFAGAIQDYGRGIILGDNSFGKGTVQTLMTLSRGQLKLTTAKFYRISGESTQHRGVIPDLNFPSLYDKSKIGESALKDALPWDSIEAVPHFIYADLTNLKQQLKVMHAARMENDPDYIYTLSMNTYLKDLQSRTHLSLKYPIRLQEKKVLEKERLELENRLRKAKGLKPYKNMDQINSKEKEQEENGEFKRNKPAKDDGEIIEGGNIIVDELMLQNRVNTTRSSKTAVN